MREYEGAHKSMGEYETAQACTECAESTREYGGGGNGGYERVRESMGECELEPRGFQAQCVPKSANAMSAQ